MPADLPTLRAQVEAAQALAARATPGQWEADVDRGELGDRVSVLRLPSGAPDDAGEMLAEAWTGKAADGQMLAAAPDLVTYLTDALALAESQAAELDAIRAALGNGADEAAWPPGLTVAEAVGRLVEEWTKLRWQGRCGHILSQRVEGHAVIRRTCPLPADHEGPHAEALAAGNDGEDDGA